MKKKQTIKPIALAISAAFAATAGAGIASADSSPFSATHLASGYMLDAGGDAGADADKGKEGKCGEGKCGEKKGEEGKCGEGKCGEKKGEEGKCGEGKCGGKEKGAEGSCGESKDKDAEASCGGMR